MSVKIWRYCEPNKDENRGGWFIAFVDQAGCLAVLSDYGDFSHRWSHPNGTGVTDMRRFLLRCGNEYVQDKLGYNVKAEFDGEATRKLIKEHIIQYRRCGSLDKEEATKEWELLKEQSFDDQIDFHAWLSETRMSDAYEFCCTHRPGLEAFMRQVWLRLRAAINADVAAETEPPVSTEA